MTSSLSSLVGQPLTWVPTSEHYNLIAPDNSVIATFPVEPRGWGDWRDNAKALVPDGALFLRATPSWRRSFLLKEDQKVAISAVEQGPPLATYHRERSASWSCLVFPDRRVFWWGPPNFWAEELPDQVKEYNKLLRNGLNRFLHVSWAYLTQKAWTDQTGTTVYVQFSDWMRESHVVIYPPATEIPELSLLLVLGLYNILIGRDERTVKRGARAWKNALGEISQHH